MKAKIAAARIVRTGASHSVVSGGWEHAPVANAEDIRKVGTTVVSRYSLMGGYPNSSCLRLLRVILEGEDFTA